MKSSFNVKYHHDIVTMPVKVSVSVTQKNKTLYNTVIDLRCYHSPLRIEFEFDNLEPIDLVFATTCEDMDLFPFYVDRIELDDLADITSTVHNGTLTKNNKMVDKGNCLYRDGNLIYTFDLPFCKNYNVNFV